MKLILAALLLALPTIAHSGVVTLITRATTPTNWTTNEIALGPYEVAELISFPYPGGGAGQLNVIKDGETFNYRPASGLFSPPAPFDPVVVAGPATLRLISWATNYPVMCTFRITPEAFPPDRALLVPPGTNQMQVTLECSTNLVHWFPATNGVYGPLPEAKFFRIRADKLQ